MSMLAPTLQAFFTDRLLRQREASPHTVAAYRDTWRLLLSFASQRRVAPGALAPGAPTDPDVPNSGIRLLGLRARYTTVYAVHDLSGR